MNLLVLGPFFVMLPWRVTSQHLPAVTLGLAVSLQACAALLTSSGLMRAIERLGLSGRSRTFFDVVTAPVAAVGRACEVVQPTTPTAAAPNAADSTARRETSPEPEVGIGGRLYSLNAIKQTSCHNADVML